MPEPCAAAEGGPVLSIIVVSYNTREMTLACLQSISEQTQLPHEVIVIDNRSDDGSADAISAAFPDHRLIRAERNLGFAAANNLAAREARGDFLLLLNPDTLVLCGALDRLVAFARKWPDARIWGGRTLYADGRLNPGSCWGRMTLWSLASYALMLNTLFPRSAVFNPEGYGGWARDTEGAVDIVSGCLLLMRREDWGALGGFAPAFFMYGEDADLCLRARAELGARPVITPDAEIIHYGGASEAIRADKMVRLLTAKVSLIQRHFPNWQRALGLRLLKAGVNNRRLIAVRSRGRLARGGAAEWAAIWARRTEWERGFG